MPTVHDTGGGSHEPEHGLDEPPEMCIRDRTVTVAEIDTTLVDAGDGDHVIASGKVKLTDAIEYKGLVPGDTYTAHGTLIVKSTGMPLEDADGKPVTATAEFSPDKADGAADVSFEFDASKIEEGVELVAFEECLDVNGNVVAVHQDIDDDGQTVVVDNPDTPEVLSLIHIFMQSIYEVVGIAIDRVMVMFGTGGALDLAAVSIVTPDDDIPALLAMLIVSLISWVVVLAAYIVALVVCWARALQLYIMAAFSPIPLAFMALDLSLIHI